MIVEIEEDRSLDDKQTWETIMMVELDVAPDSCDVSYPVMYKITTALEPW